MIRRVLATMVALSATVSAQTYQPRQTFAPFDMGQPVNTYRGADGLPGPGYWRNRADYRLHVTLDPATKTISGVATITYTNNSPGPLDTLWLQLDQNAYRPGSRAGLSRGGTPAGATEGMVIEAASVTVGKARVVAVTPQVSDTRAQLRLPAALDHGGRAVVSIRYHYTIPHEWGGRTSWGRSRDGEIYDIAQWYPRMAVYDDVRGWDTAPYLAHEFYLEYGDFDYWVTVPAAMLVAGSGGLVNPAEVLTATRQRRLVQAARSDATVTIRGVDEITDPASRPQRGGTLTWHYRMAHTRDVAFAASSAFAWDAARINLPAGRSALAMSYFPAGSAGAERWGRSTEYVKDTVERFSARWYPYQWPAAINVAGPTSGM